MHRSLRSSASPHVERAVKDLGIRYPVALDNSYDLWRALKNNIGPPITSSMHGDASATIISAKGIMRRSERVIRQLLAEAGRAPGGQAMRAVEASGAQAAAAIRDIRSPETYIGYAARRISSRPAGCHGCREDLRSGSAFVERLGARGRWLDGRQSAFAHAGADHPSAHAICISSSAR